MKMYSYIDPIEGESFEEYRFRVYKLKQSGQCRLRWADIALMFGEKFGAYFDESKWRKEAKEILMSDIESVTSDDTSKEDSVKELLQEIRKERMKISDERVQNNAILRRMSREETIKEIAFAAAKEMSSKKMLDAPVINKFSTVTHNDAILQLSDWHYGIDVNTYWNKFNPDVCRERVSTLLTETIEFCEFFDVNSLYLVNLGDLICGRIHQTLRLQSRIDTITQIMQVSEILAEFISALTSKGLFVYYYDCLDNHSRLEPNKADSLELESLARITPWFLSERLKNNDQVEICCNTYDNDIISFEVNGYKVGGVHGHKDKPGKVVDGLTLMTKQNYDLILTAHLHHFNSDEQNEVMVISNGSLMGTDYYAKDLRLSAKPSQNLILVNEKSVADYIHRVVLD